jgi:hypothetical protein
MANEKDDVLKANAGAPAADIPDLKKKEKERKKAGAAWSGARGAAGEFSGASGGNVARAAASAASAAGEAAVGAAGAAEALGGGGLWATIARVFAGLTSTLLGKLAVAAAAFLMMAAAGMIGYGILKGSGGDGSVGGLNLGGITDSMKVRAGGSDRIGISGGGDLRFDPLTKTAAKAPEKKEEAKPEEKPAEAAPEKLDAANGSGAMQDKLAHNLSGAKLSTSLGGDFGNKNIFAGNNANAPKFDISKAGMPKLSGTKGKMGAMKAGGRRASASSRSMNRGKTGRAIGQLKLAKGMSMLGAGASSAEGAAAAANGAFDQQQPVGGDLNSNMPGDTVAPPSDGGAPDTSMPDSPATPTYGGTDPGLKNALDQIGKMADAARQMKQTGMMLIAIGVVIMAIGYKVLGMVPYGTIIGAILIAIGLGLVVMGKMMMDMADKMAAMAKQMGSALSAQIGDPHQGAVINSCTDQALAGTQTSQCNTSNLESSQYDQENTQGVNTVQHMNDDKPVLVQGAGAKAK